MMVLTCEQCGNTESSGWATITERDQFGFKSTVVDFCSPDCLKAYVEELGQEAV